MTATGSKLNLGSSGVASISDARSAITSIDVAITEVAAERGNLGAFQNRLSFTIAYTENEIENIQASEASISDADGGRGDRVYAGTDPKSGFYGDVGSG